jgi:hypothetical protein
MSVKLVKTTRKINRIISKYRTLLRARASGGNLAIIRGNKTRNKVLDFFQKHGRWPSRLSKNVTERKLGQSFENFCSKETPSYDPQLRRIAMATGRTTNNKRKHNVAGFKQQILDFIKEHGRAPTTHQGETIEGEGNLRHKLDYYTKQCNDMTLLGQVYAGDKCHKSGIPMKFRALINEALSKEEKPLIRQV